MHETHGRLATLMFVRVTEKAANKKEIPVSQSRLDVLQKSLSIYVKHYHGDLVEISSGEIFAYFPGAVLAFNAAAGLSRLMPQFSLRIGLHVGEVLVRQEKLQGVDVNLAARLPYCSRAGGICLSQTVYQYLDDDQKQKLITLGRHDLKNFDIQIPLYAYLPEGQEGRHKMRELWRRFVTMLQKFRKQGVFKFYLISLLAVLLAILIWSQRPLPIQPGGTPVIVNVPEFMKTAQDERSRRLLESVETTVRSQLAGSHGDLRLNLGLNSAAARAVLLVKLNAEAGKLKAEYILKSQADGHVLSSGVLEAENTDIFQFQDRISRKILLDIGKH